MTIRLSGILRDPFGNTSPRTSIQVTSVTTFGDTLMSAVAVHQTNDNGQYDFNVVAGRHKVEVRYQYEYVKVGDFFVGSDQTGTFTISQAMDLVTPPSDPALAEMRRILDEVNQATLGLDADVLAAAASAEQAANSALAINGIRDQVEGFRDQASESAFNAEQSAIRAEAAAENAEGGGAVGGGVNISITGQSYAVRGRFTTWEITDFDDFSPYEVTTPAGTTGTINGRFLTINIPDDFAGDNISFSITRDTFSRAFVVRVLDIAIGKPSITYPENGSTSVGAFDTITASNFNSDPLTIIHTQTEWQVDTSPLFNSPVINSGIIGASSQLDVKLYIPTGLIPNVVYFARVRYYGIESGNQMVSEWSNATGFTIQSNALGLWQKTASFPISMIDNAFKTTVKVGDFLVTFNINFDGTNVFVYNKSGTVISQRFFLSDITNNNYFPTLRTSTIIERNDPTGGNIHIVSLSIVNQTSSSDVIVMKVSGVTGSIVDFYETTSAISNGNFSTDDYNIPINSYIEQNLGEITPHILLPHEAGYHRINNPFQEFGKGVDSNPANVSGLLTKENFETIAPLRYATNAYANVVNKAFKINLSTGDTWFGQQSSLADNPSAGGSISERSISISPVIHNVFSHNVVLSSVIKSPEFMNEGKDVVLIFNPDPLSPLSTPMFVDLGGEVVAGQSFEWTPIAQVNNPDLTNPIFLDYVAHSVTKPDSPNESHLQLVVRLEDSVQVWEMNLGGIM